MSLAFQSQSYLFLPPIIRSPLWHTRLACTFKKTPHFRSYFTRQWKQTEGWNKQLSSNSRVHVGFWKPNFGARKGCRVRLKFRRKKQPLSSKINFMIFLLYFKDLVIHKITSSISLSLSLYIYIYICTSRMWLKVSFKQSLIGFN